MLKQDRSGPIARPSLARRLLWTVAGVLILLEVLGLFGLGSVEASERDILCGVALATATG